MSLVPHQILADKYQLERLLGQGGMGAVYVAMNLALQRRVALKVMNDEFAAKPDAVERFHREAIAASRVSHPSIVQVFDAGRFEGKPWISMELLDGESLAHRLQRGRMTVDEAVAMATGILSALEEVHREGVIHRDLKPDNIFLAYHRDGTWTPKILDFGVAKVAREDGLHRLTMTGAVVGTALYLAPEQAQGVRDIDARIDVYAMGVVLCECLSGQRPYDVKSLGELIGKMLSEPPRSLGTLAPDLPAELVPVVDRCLAFDRAERHPSAEALLTAITQVHREIKARRSPTGPSAQFAFDATAPIVPPPPGGSWSEQPSVAAAGPISDGSSPSVGSAFPSPGSVPPLAVRPPGISPGLPMQWASAGVPNVAVSPVPRTRTDPKRHRAIAIVTAAVGGTLVIALAVGWFGVFPKTPAPTTTSVTTPEQPSPPTPPPTHASITPSPSEDETPSKVEDPSTAPPVVATTPSIAPEEETTPKEAPVATPSPKTAAPPRMTKARETTDDVPPPVVVRSGLTDEQLSVVIRDRRQYMQKRCYAKRIRRVGPLPGTVTVTWTVLADGRVLDAVVADNTTGDDWLGRCTRNVISDHRFPPTSGLQSTRARHTFRYP